jgi:N-methylhydantoinase B
VASGQLWQYCSNQRKSVITLTDLITSELIRNSLLYASEEMGIALRNSSYSPNIKERMDHSAALFDSEGRLLSQAEHIPVHLGSLPWGLKNTIDYCQKQGIEFEKESMIVVNNPYISGTHLNDVTVISPIFHSEARLVGFAANKAHHSDVGGKVPGSISVDAKTLFEEGFIMNPTYLMRKGEFVNETLSTFSSNSRTPYERLGDLKAQVAANVIGIRRMLETIEKYSLDDFIESSHNSFHYSEIMLRRRLSIAKTGKFRSIDYLEHPDGSDLKLKLTVTIREDEIEFDYGGTDDQIDMPLNAVFGVTLSGVYFVLKTLFGDDIPTNDGIFVPVKIRAPFGSLLNPTFPFPVAGGNVETSQRNADLIYKALAKAMPQRVPAASGGSMNNIMVGGIHNGRNWAFYETIGVGLGGRMGVDGTDGIQSNMTNTMNTPIEEIEMTMPLRIERYEFRVNSSGPGTFRGGSGVIRAFRACDDCTLTVLSERGRHEPWGLSGGKGGSKTRVLHITTRRSGQREVKEIPIKATIQLRRGEVIEIHTAGGGGYGPPRSREKSRLLSDVENQIVSKKGAIKSGYRIR